MRPVGAAPRGARFDFAPLSGDLVFCARGCRTTRRSFRVVFGLRFSVVLDLTPYCFVNFFERSRWPCIVA